jgi:hypothetical protein
MITVSRCGPHVPLPFRRHVHGDLEDLAGVPVAQDAQQLRDVTPAGRHAAGAQELPRVHEQPFPRGSAVLQVCGERDHRAQVAGTRDVIDHDRRADVLKAPDLAVPVLRGTAVALNGEMQQPLRRHTDLLMRRGDDHRSRPKLSVGPDDLDASAGAELLLQCGVERATEALGHPSANLAGRTEDQRAVAQKLRLEGVEPDGDKVLVDARL